MERINTTLENQKSLCYIKQAPRRGTIYRARCGFRRSLLRLSVRNPRSTPLHATLELPHHLCQALAQKILRAGVVRR